MLLELNRMVGDLKNHAEEFAEPLVRKPTRDYERESRNSRQGVAVEYLVGKIADFLSMAHIAAQVEGEL